MFRIWRIYVGFIILFLLTFGVGFLNHKNFQRETRAETEIQLKDYFSERKESVIEIIDPGHSIEGEIEVGVITEKEMYYAVLQQDHSLWVSGTILNLFMRPQVVLQDVRIAEVKGTSLSQ
jgi:hypothetical protein